MVSVSEVSVLESLVTTVGAGLEVEPVLRLPRALLDRRKSRWYRRFGGTESRSVLGSRVAVSRR